MELNKRIGQVIKTIRIYNGIKQKELADSLQVKSSLLSLYEHGKREINIRFLCALCSFLDISLSYFFYLVEQDNHDKIMLHKFRTKEALETVTSDQH